MSVTDATILAVARDERGRVVAKASRQYRLRREEHSAGAKDGLFFTGCLDLPPGRYQVQVAAFDAVAARGAVAESVVQVPIDRGVGPTLSEIVLVEATQKLDKTGDGGGETEQDFLRYGENRLIPMLSTRIRRGERPKLVFFFVVGGGKRRPAESWVEVRRGDSVIVRSWMPLPEAEPDGLIRCAGILPVGQWPPGNYVLRVFLDTSTESAREVAFTVTE